ncbi:HAAS signaling domain-containing protein [Saccharopolyspora cebuensis]|uniref:DUF1700 domain-containing protein n=1 Tax=Saccharopolyspora cebuensis TaxID=418759 RepID=A0ABV4CPE3_9PSEU
MTKTHPRVTTYLDELDKRLRHAPAAVRRDVLAGAHEHLDASVGPDADAATVDAALARMGTPEAIAAEAGVETGSARQGSLLAAAVACALLAGAGALTFLVGGLVSLSAGFDENPDWSVSGAAHFAAVLLSAMAWISGSALVALNRSWSGRQKVLLLASWPVALVVCELCYLPTGDVYLTVNLVSFCVQGVLGLLYVVAIAKLWFAARG